MSYIQLTPEETKALEGILVNPPTAPDWLRTAVREHLNPKHEEDQKRNLLAEARDRVLAVEAKAYRLTEAVEKLTLDGLSQQKTINALTWALVVAEFRGINDRANIEFFRHYGGHGSYGRTDERVLDSVYRRVSEATEALRTANAQIEDQAQQLTEMRAQLIEERMKAVAVDTAVDNARNEILRDIGTILDAMPQAVRVHEGGGPEDVMASLAVTCSKFTAASSDQKAKDLHKLCEDAFKWVKDMNESLDENTRRSGGQVSAYTISFKRGLTWINQLASALQFQVVARVGGGVGAKPKLSVDTIQYIRNRLRCTTTYSYQRCYGCHNCKCAAEFEAAIGART